MWDIILLLFNLGYLCQHLGTIHQIYVIIKKRSVEGFSVDTQILFLIGTIARALWINDTMLKDFWLTYAELALAFITLLSVLFLVIFKYNSSYTILQSIFAKPGPFYERWYIIFIVTLILSYFFFPGNEGQSYDIQMLVSLNIFIDAGGLIPQIPLMYREKDSDTVSKYYLLLLSFSRIFRLIFWLHLWKDGQDFIFLIIADIIHLIFVSGFIYSFFKNLNKLLLPTEEKQDFSKKMF